MIGTEAQTIYCPYCGEPGEVLLDTSVEQQEYIEDCQVCCRPITFRVAVEGEQTLVQTLHENDY